MPRQSDPEQDKEIYELKQIDTPIKDIMKKFEIKSNKSVYRAIERHELFLSQKQEKKKTQKDTQKDTKRHTENREKDIKTLTSEKAIISPGAESEKKTQKDTQKDTKKDTKRHTENDQKQSYDFDEKVKSEVENIPKSMYSLLNEYFDVEFHNNFRDWIEKLDPKVKKLKNQAQVIGQVKINRYSRVTSVIDLILIYAKKQEEEQQLK